MKIVPLKKPAESEAIIETLTDLIERANSGEFDSLLILAFRPDGKFWTIERGKRHNRLEMVGLLETMKLDLLKTMET